MYLKAFAGSLLACVLAGCSPITGFGDFGSEATGNGAPTTDGTDPFHGEPGEADDDLDGWGASVDCNDQNPDINPGEVDDSCDGIDQNCDGTDGDGKTQRSANSCGGVDEDGDHVYDVDGDGNVVDCDDSDPDVFPGAPEECGDGVDQDCNGEDLECEEPPVEDEDNDGWTIDEGDCDDLDDTRNPAETDLCEDGIDQDCSGEDAECEETEFDVDGDGFEGDLGDGTDCDDADPEINPDAEDIAYDGIDQDCSGEDLVDVDCDAYDAIEFGGSDCDDTLETGVDVFPGAPELCDGKDNNCDEVVDESCPEPFDGTVELCFTDISETVTNMDIYVLNLSTSDFGNWFSDPSGDPTSELCTIVGDDICCSYSGSDYEVSEGDTLKIQGQQGGTYLVFGDEADDVHAQLTCNGHPATVLDNGAGGGDYTCTAQAPIEIEEEPAPEDTGIEDTGTEPEPEDTGLAECEGYWRDRDGDGYGDPGSTSETPQVGYVSCEMGEDCDDYDSNVYPGNGC